MAERWAVKAGGWSDLTLWNGGATFPGVGDDCYTNNFAVTIDQDISVASLRNTAGTTAVTGGAFTVSSANRTLTLSVGIYSAAVSVLTYSNAGTLNLTSPNTFPAGAGMGLVITGGGTVNYTGSLTGGNVAGGHGCSITTVAGAVLNVFGNVTGGSLAAVTGITANAVQCTINVLGGGGVNGGSVGTTSYGVNLAANGTLNIGSSGTPGSATSGAAAAASVNATAGTTINAWGAMNGLSTAGAFNLNGGSVNGSGLSSGAVISGTVAPTINGSINGGSAASTLGLNLGGAVIGTCSVTGDVTGGTNTNCHGIQTAGPVVVNVVGNVKNGTASTGDGILYAAGASGTITGNVRGDNGGTAAGVVNSGVGAVVIFGDSYGAAGSLTGYGWNNTGAGTVTQWGTARPGGVGVAPAPAINVGTSTGCFCQVITANDYPNGGVTVAAAGAIGTSALGAINYDGMVEGSGGYPSTQTIRSFARSVGVNYVTVRDGNAGNQITLGEATDYPTVANVRLGTSYNFGAQIGTCAVPPAGSVAIGVPVGATTGTAGLTPTLLLGASTIANLATITDPTVVAAIVTIGNPTLAASLAALGNPTTVSAITALGDPALVARAKEASTVATVSAQLAALSTT